MTDYEMVQPGVWIQWIVKRLRNARPLGFVWVVGSKRIRKENLPLPVEPVALYRSGTGSHGTETESAVHKDGRQQMED